MSNKKRDLKLQSNKCFLTVIIFISFISCKENSKPVKGLDNTKEIKGVFFLKGTKFLRFQSDSNRTDTIKSNELILKNIINGNSKLTLINNMSNYTYSYGGKIYTNRIIYDTSYNSFSFPILEDSLANSFSTNMLYILNFNNINYDTIAMYSTKSARIFNYKNKKEYMDIWNNQIK